MMLFNYLKVALRNLRNHKLYSFINIGGLGIGLAACLMISLFVHFEFSYEEFIDDADRVYRLSLNMEETPLGPARRKAANVAPLAPLIADNNFAGVESVARIGGMPVMLERDNIVSTGQALRWVDPAFFDIVSLQWLQGDRTNALAEPNSIVLTTSKAQQYFGTADPMGQTLLLENTWEMTVTGIVADFPDNSHFDGDVFVNMDTAWALEDFDYSNNWSYDNFHTYIKLAPDADIQRVRQQIMNAIVGESAQLDAAAAEFFHIREGIFSFSPVNVLDIHLHSGRSGEFREPGSIDQVLIFSAIAISLLLIACINFMNLTTAKATQRAKEIGIRKAFGVGRRSLIGQFLGESVLLSSLALLIALVLSETLVSVFGAAMGRQLEFTTLFEPGFMAFIVCITLLTGLLAGSYPAFYLATLRPSRAFRADALQANRTLGLRNILVVFQFLIAITLIVATLVVFLQMRYMQGRDLGFSSDNILVLSGTAQDGLGAQWQTFRDRLSQYPEVIGITEESMAPGFVGNRSVRVEGGAPGGFSIQAKSVGFGFFETYGIGLVAGRSFNEELRTDIFTPPPSAAEGEALTASYMLNESAVASLGLTADEVIGRKLELDFSTDFSLAVSGPIIGVVRDVHLSSLRVPIAPAIYYVPPERWGNLPGRTSASIRIDGRNVEQTVALIQDTWEQTITDVPFVYRFLETDYEMLYRDEQQHGRLFMLFALLTVGIACLGLFGLASFTVERRRKEIGVRKVVGGSVLNIVFLLTNDFSKLVLVANVIAWPLAWVAMNRWLEQFAYRIDLTPMIFIGSGLIALCVAWVTVGGTAAKAASLKPVLALRYE